MTVTVDPKTVGRHAPLGAAAHAQLSPRAGPERLPDRPVPDALLREALDLAKMGPTAANQQPLRVVFLRSREAKERLRPAMAPGNVEKTMAAPVGCDHGLRSRVLRASALFDAARGRQELVFGRRRIRGAQRGAKRNPSGRLFHPRVARCRPRCGSDGRISIRPRSRPSSFRKERSRPTSSSTSATATTPQLFPRSPRLSFDQMAKSSDGTGASHLSCPANVNFRR